MKLLDWIDKNNLNWPNLSDNPNAIELLKQNPNKINWMRLSRNLYAIDLIKDNLDKIDWYSLSENPNAIEILKENPEKIKWYNLSRNPSIFTYDYEKMRNLNQDLKEEIIAAALHPKRIFRLIEEYGEEEIYNIYFDD